MKKDFDTMAKVAVIGDSAVGKTNLLVRYVSADYHQTHIATIGIDFKVKTIDINGFRIKLQIWDTAGQERFRNLTGTIYQGAEAVILTYAINNRHSFESLTRWMDDVRNYAKKEVVVGIVGNKCDLEAERAVRKEEGQALAATVGAIFYETSAKDNINVEDIFRSIAVELHKKIMQKSKEGDLKLKEKTKTGTPAETETSKPKERSQTANSPQKERPKSKITLDTHALKEATQEKKKKCC